MADHDLSTDSPETKTFLGTKRRKTTPWRVRAAEFLASRIIAIGGLGTILAVLLVVVVLVFNSFPLLMNASVANARSIKLPDSVGTPVKFGADEHRMYYWILDQSASIHIIDAIHGDSIQSFPPSQPLPEGVKLTVAAAVSNAESMILGFSDGTIRLVQLKWENRYLNLTDLAPELQTKLKLGPCRDSQRLLRPLPGGLVQSTSLVSVQHQEPISVGTSPIDHLDYVFASINQNETKHSWIASSGDQFAFGQIRSKYNAMSKKTKVDSTIQTTKLSDHSVGEVIGLTLSPMSDYAMVGSSNGEALRLELSTDKPPSCSELHNLDHDQRFVSNVSAPLLGRETMIIGDDRGSLLGVFSIRSQDAPEASVRLAAVHHVEVASQPIRRIACSPMARIAAGITQEGKAGVAFIPTDQELLRFEFPVDGESIRDFNFCPKGDAIIALCDRSIHAIDFDPGYPEASFRALFRPLWYEGYDRPSYMWQSTSATVSTEAKLSMIPLLIGTLKSTFYTLLFSVPLALMAAIYTSEFMDRKWRARIKPSIEMMASVPSVVLGFIAALVLAPILRDQLAVVLTAIILVPFSYLLFAHFWCMLPVNSMVRWNWLRVPLLVVPLVVGMLIARALAAIAESWLFEGSLLSWLASQGSVNAGGWFLLLLPIQALLIVLLFVFGFGPATRQVALKTSPLLFSFLNLVRFVLGTILWIASTYLLANFFSSYFGDLRGFLLGSYQERNAMLVGAILGFAVIPIIYTISEDALQSVPQHLRSASLGCGATPWQTTIRVVVPTAMSGLFSAIMVGFGRAVGETMVVLMAAGNTPLMDMNPFNGYRTLSATLATELPEAAVGSAHFRTLFLAALLLFAMTLVANTAAELVRSRFRKRAYQL